MNQFFEIKRNLAEELPSHKSPNFTSKYLLGHYAKIKHVEKDLGRLPEPEEFFFLQTDGAFNAFTFIPFVAQHCSIKHLYAVTYSISRRSIEALMEMHDAGIIEEITLLINDSMPKRNPVTIDILNGLIRTRANIKVQYAWVHAKFCLMETISGHYCIEGSGNWAENAEYEQYVFGNSRGLYEFRKELFTNIKPK
jgi:hypothetical protein